MDTTSVLVAFTAILLTVYGIWNHVTKRGLPPSPALSLPIVGHLLVIDPKFGREQMQGWREKVGDVFRLHFGPQLYIVLNGYDVIREAFVKKADDFSHRPFFYFEWAIDSDGLGILAASGPNWKEQRTSTIGILRNMGMGKNVLAERIHEEVEEYLTALGDLKGKPTDVRFLTNRSVSNIICSVLIGQRFEYDDPIFMKLIEMLNYNITHFASIGAVLLTIFPNLHYIPGDIFNVHAINRNRREFRSILSKYWKEILSNKENDVSNTDNYITKYVEEKDQKEEKGQATYLDEKNLVACIDDLFAAGTETTSTTINWFLLYMLNYPHVQEKIFEEIDNEIGSDKPPTMNDRNKLVYLNAAIMETQRIGNITPIGLNHMCARDTTLRGFRIPKGANVIGNMTSVFFDKNIWGEDIDTFKPERFIDDTGKLKHFDEFIPFSVGRRACAGEALAKMELFLYIASMCQRFQFLAPDPKCPPEIVPIVSITRSPAPYEIRCVDRRLTSH